MDTAQFLTRITPPGNYSAIAFNPHPERPGNGFIHKFFPEGSTAAAGILRWAASKNMDAYHAMASFTMATADGADARGVQNYKGSRTRDNVHRIKALWVDLDVKRDGDKKDPANVYPSQIEAMRWVASFQAAIDIPRPNIVVNSGYGLHIYWVLETALTAAEWAPYGSAMRAALAANGFKGDAGLSADMARILRPPGTVNMKSGTPVPVTVFPRLTRADYPNDLVLGALAPYVGAVATVRASTAMPGGGASVTALSGGGASAALAHAAAPNMTAAAATLPSQVRVHEFSRIATQCGQVATTLANRGKGDDRPLWYLGNLTLAHFCADGAQYVHAVGDGDPRYTKAGTDAAVAKIAADHARINMGPPTCGYYEKAGHKNVCQVCPHRGRINSPWLLGAEGSDLPRGYRRHQGDLQRWVDGKDGGFWVKLLAGDVYGPVLDARPLGGYTLQFTYGFAGRRHTIRVDEADLGTGTDAVKGYFAAQSLSLSRTNATAFGDFIVSWLESLREQRAERDSPVMPFGWAAAEDGTHQGFAVAGTLYRADGGEDLIAGGDRGLLASFKPRGTLEAWKSAAAMVMRGRPDLQTLVAASFAAPLVHLTGYKGLAFSAWSRDSAIGKSSALRVGQTVWSSVSMMNSLDDTPNSIRAKIAQSRVLVSIWDEVRLGKDTVEAAIAMLFSLTQGKDKQRMNSDTTLRGAGEWETMLVMAGNAPIMDHIVHHVGATDAGAVRLYEMHLEHPQVPLDPAAAIQINQVETNYGRAGAIYAAWLGANRDAAAALVAEFSRLLNARLGGDRAERYHVATMATIMAGAKVANQLGLTQFDLRPMMALLSKTFDKLRAARRDTLVVHSGNLDLEQVLATFVADNLGSRLITDHIAARGPSSKVAVLWDPQKGAAVEIQIAIQTQTMRIAAHTLLRWCYKNGYPSTEIIKEMAVRWGAVRARRQLGAGTVYGGGQLSTIDLPLVAPELAGYLHDPRPAAMPPRQAPAMAGAPPPPVI